MDTPSQSRRHQARQGPPDPPDVDARQIDSPNGDTSPAGAALSQAERLKRLKRMGLAILSADSSESIVNIAVGYVRETIDCLHAGISLYDPTEEAMIVLGSGDDAWPSGTRVPLTRKDAKAAFSRGVPYYLPDVSAVSDGSPGLQYARSLGGRSLLAVPVRVAPMLLGTLWIITAEVRDFTAEEMTLAREVADVVALTLQNRRLLMDEHRAREREHSLREIAASLTLDLELGEVLRHILDHLRRLIPFASAGVLLRDGQELAFAAPQDIEVRPEQLELVRWHMPRIVRELMDSGRPAIIDDTTNDARWEALAGFEYIRSWMGIPLSYRGTCIGALTIDRDRVRAFSDDDLELALAFASQVAVAIENARLFQEVQSHALELDARVRERTRELEALFGITAATIATPELDTVLARALDLAMGVFGCCTGAIHLVQPGEGVLELKAHLDREGRDLVGLLAHSAVATHIGRAIAGTTIWRAEELPREGQPEWLRAVAAAPLRALGQRVGVLSLWSDTAGAFNDATRPLTAITNQLGAAIENLQLRQKTREAAIIEERERLARDLHDAVTQTIFSAGLFAEAARESARAGDLGLVERHTQTVVERIYQALGEMRLLLFELRTDTLAERGLAGALSDRLKAVEERASIATELRVEGVPELPLALEETLYRVALEALNNALRHSHARRVSITLRAADGWLVLTVRDNGVGFRRRDVPRGSGMGLDTMATRIAKVGGHIRIQSRPGRGTRVEVRAPLPATSLPG